MTGTLKAAFHRLLPSRLLRTRSGSPSHASEPPAKHLPFFKLTEACGSQQCPLCRLRANALEAYLESLVYQGVNDRGFRAEFDRNYGFCAYHEHAFLAKQDRLAIVITHRELIARALEGGTPPDAGSQCSLCRLLEETEQQYLKTTEAYLHDTELRQALEDSAGFCLPHYRKLCARLRQTPNWLDELQRSRLRTVLEAVDEYIEISNYSLSDNLSRLSKPHLRRLPDVVIGMLFGYNPDQDTGT